MNQYGFERGSRSVEMSIDVVDVKNAGSRVRSGRNLAGCGAVLMLFLQAGSGEGRACVRCGAGLDGTEVHASGSFCCWKLNCSLTCRCRSACHWLRDPR
ncbi:uncharacterized protein BKA55DRAFT_59527 [Fusarium redolens]|uniref:Uncharacterized protein n=1 Tax=Fusarium redolens TaxID=48865 RepID=A0A9P9KXS7_FUSRE|nr:uncharacterized protein BKA55DRAFT_59527 [Fusarium redolens]KAH7270765.1 hypothetical protein BKA55DRAFT_59527 [Fusarium redolens]